ncbi:hypothetical protein [Mycobacterium angelicum]|uniref:Uncharacterized protein n=1 Tax=Mycobacterium angelicum TaxID=470074 RepID=A0A1W9ZVL6_MYCAN|nr:hypothetical protein [Mycobacterium angelicum]MCV7198587.1 hypothetical protein [Mycobacterium angelicum]ORA21566.1 hypothetical protein BST12_12200 [Mycobacterium angelicum]
MNSNQQTTFDLGTSLAPYASAIIFFWLLSAIVAAAVAPRGRETTFFFLTLVFLGPLGVGFAAVAAPREPDTAMPGRAGLVCPRCAATQYIKAGAQSFDCWRCDQSVDIEYPRFGGPRVEAAAKTKIPEGRRKFICPRCGAAQNVPENDSSYECWQCGDHRVVQSKKIAKAAKTTPQTKSGK